MTTESLRDDWKFRYPARDVLAGARAKLNHHRTRLAWWTRKKEDVIAEVKLEGIEIDESVVEKQHFSNAYRDETVRIRNDLMRDLQETVAKVREHRGMIENYSAWCEVLEVQGDTQLELKKDDWMFFFSHHDAAAEPVAKAA